ncbi:hypothetical protein KDA08_02425 [Candidatus Saccharibacteria bacterium]|nr:hypothetical protein [Candidatus Saccharibacteria bacterium]
MDTSTISTRANGQKIIASWFNLIKTLLGTAVDYKVVTTQSVAASGTVTVDTTMKQIRKVSSSSGSETASTTPFGSTAANFEDGMEVTLIGTSDTNILTIPTNDAQYGVLSPVGDATLQDNFSVTYIYDETAERFIEKCRNH